MKYYVLLPSINQIGSSLDNVQWETILRSVGGQRSFRWVNDGEATAKTIANFLIFDGRMPRSLTFSVGKIATNLGYLQTSYNARLKSQTLVEALSARLDRLNIDHVFEDGLHEFLLEILRDINALGEQIAQDYRFLD